MNEHSTTPPSNPSDSQTGTRFDSWKEIGAYLKRDVRTVQRWEKTEGLPVRRHLHQKQGTVFAYKSDLDTWWHERQKVLENAPELGEASLLPESESSDAQGLETDEREATSRETQARGFRWLWNRQVMAVLLGLLLLGGVSYYFEHVRTSGFTGKAKLVVLPFRNLTGDPGKEVFCRGLTEALTTQLGRLDPDHLGIIATATATLIQDKPVDEIRQKLGVDYLLEGSVVQSGSQMRIDAQLIQASDQTHRWADSYNRDASDILALQNEVARDVASEIRLTLSPAEQARLTEPRKIDPEAYDDYLRGLVDWSKRTPDGVSKSLDYFQQAIHRSPDFALPYAGVANAYTILSAVPTAMVSPLEAMPKAKEAAETAVRLDPESAEAHAALAIVRQGYDYDFDGAEKEYARALKINPSYGTARQWRSLLLMARGRHDDALAEIELAHTLDPLSPVIPSSPIQALYFDRQYDRAIEESRKALEVEPDFLIIRYHLGQSLLQKGFFPQAIAELREAQRISGGSTVCEMALGHAYAVSGNRAGAMQSLAKLNSVASKGQYVPALYFAAIYTGLGDRNQAMKWLEKAYEERTEYLIFLKVEPMADPLRDDSRFKDLLRRVGLD